MNRQRAVLGLAENICSLASSAALALPCPPADPASLPRSNDPREQSNTDCVLGAGEHVEFQGWELTSGPTLWALRATLFLPSSSGEASASSWRSADNFSLCSFYAFFSNHHHHHPHHPPPHCS